MYFKYKSKTIHENMLMDSFKNNLISKLSYYNILTIVVNFEIMLSENNDENLEFKNTISFFFPFYKSNISALLILNLPASISLSPSQVENSGYFSRSFLFCRI